MTEKNIVSNEECTQGIDGFLGMLKEMEESGETERTILGSVDGPFFSKAVYSCAIKIGIEDGFR